MAQVVFVPISDGDHYVPDVRFEAERSACFFRGYANSMGFGSYFGGAYAPLACDYFEVV